MFDIGFWELSLIAVIALLILGPERLPRAARQAGLWAAKAKKMVSEVKSNINEELRMEELNAIKKAGEDLKSDLKSATDELGSVGQELNRSADEISGAAEKVDITAAINSSAPAHESGTETEAPTVGSTAPGSGTGPGASVDVEAGNVTTATAGAAVKNGKDKPSKPKKSAAPKGRSDKAKKGKSGDKGKKSGKKREKAGA